MNDRKIYVLMATKPDIRAVQIADALDVALCDVSASLRSLVDVGDVVMSKGLAPSGQQTMVYNLSDEFKKSKEYATVMGMVPAQPAKPAVPSPAVAGPAPAAARPAPAPVAVPVFVPADQPTTSIAQRGVAYIVSRESVAESDLYAAMGLSKGRYPSAYLAAAVQAGKVHKDGANWKAGRAPTAPLGRVAAVGNIVVAPKDSSPIPQAVVDAISPPAEERAVAAPPAPADPIFRCGLWSDGVLELQRDGSTVAVLQQAEGEQLASFVNRMLLDPLGSAVQTSTQTR